MLKIEKYEETISYKNHANYVVGKKCVAVEINSKHKEPLARSDFFVSRKDWVAANSKYNSVYQAATSIGRRFDYVDSKFMREFNLYGWDSSGYTDMVDGHKISAIKKIMGADFDPDNLLYFNGYDHSVFNIKSSYPMSIAQHSDYMSGGITNEYFDLDKAKEILNNCEFAWDINIEMIPYYNASANRDAYIDFYYKVPQKRFNKRYNEFEDSQQRYCDVKKSFAQMTYKDIFKLRSAYIGDR